VSDLPARLREIACAAHVLTGEAAEEFTHDATFMQHELLAVVRLYRALGGGWTLDQPRPASSRGPGAEPAVVEDRKGR